MTGDRACVIDGCTKPQRNKLGWCGAHYMRYLRHGDPLGGRATPMSFASVPEMIAHRYRKTASCWEWLGSRTVTYPQVSINGQRQAAYRASYRHFVGEIPPGYEIDHLCRNTYCANPAHLEAVTPQVNTLRSGNPPSLNARKTHCIWGHEFTGDNLIVRNGRRSCRECRRERDRRRRKAS